MNNLFLNSDILTNKPQGMLTYHLHHIALVSLASHKEIFSFQEKLTEALHGTQSSFRLGKEPWIRPLIWHIDSRWALRIPPEW